MLQMETTNQLTISVKLIPSDSIQWEKKTPNKKTGTEGRGCFYRHKYEMMSKSYIREKSSMHLQHCTQKSRTRSTC